MTTVPTPVTRGQAPHRLYLILLTALVLVLAAGVVLLAQHDWGDSSTSGRVQVHATATLNASVSGSGAIFYSGDALDVTKSVTGTGAIIKQ